MELFIIHQIFLRWQNSKVLEKSLKEYLDTVRTNKAELVVDQNQSDDVHESEQGGETAERQRQSGSSNEEE